MDKINDRDRTLLERSLFAIKKMRSPATLKFLAHYLKEKHVAEGGYQYIMGHKH